MDKITTAEVQIKVSEGAKYTGKKQKVSSPQIHHQGQKDGFIIESVNSTVPVTFICLQYAIHIYSDV